MITYGKKPEFNCYLPLTGIVVLCLISLFVPQVHASDSCEIQTKLPKQILKVDKGLASMTQTFRAGNSFLFKAADFCFRTDNLNSGRINSGKITREKKFPPLSQQIRESKTSHKNWESKKRFGVAVSELAVIQFIPWANAKWIQKPGWANVNADIWWYNIEHGWEYDGDSFVTNNFTHPYHGNFYFNTARTNGFNFWESIPFAFGGSLLWEYFAEIYRPAFNDWINTSVSGFNLGEMTYRVANLITDNTARGSDRVWQEIFAGIINPVRVFNRMISGEVSRVHPNSDLHRQPVKLYVDGGMRRIVQRGSDIQDSASVEGLLGLRLNYGDVLESDLNMPFSSFTLWGHISNGTNFLTELHSIGLLAGWKLGGNRFHKEVFSINVSYDFSYNPAFEFGAPSVTFNFTLKNMLDDKTFVRSDLGLVAILLGSTSTEFFYGYDGRNYDFGPGPGIRLCSRVTDGNWNYISLSYTGAMIFTMSGTPESSHYLHNAMIEGQLPVNDLFAIGLAFEYYWRNSFYKLNEDVSRGSPIGRVSFITRL